mmetsp:Transcript_28022/g.75719  ORF Transcript_28022/g.75719 Transcript_28022/m.75719 type:complete len:372 (-) Transcript_28022:162-1277(-)
MTHGRCPASRIPARACRAPSPSPAVACALMRMACDHESVSPAAAAALKAALHALSCFERASRASCLLRSRAATRASCPSIALTAASFSCPPPPIADGSPRAGASPLAAVSAPAAASACAAASDAAFAAATNSLTPSAAAAAAAFLRFWPRTSPAAPAPRSRTHLTLFDSEMTRMLAPPLEAPPPPAPPPVPPGRAACVAAKSKLNGTLHTTHKQPGSRQKRASSFGSGTPERESSHCARSLYASPPHGGSRKMTNPCGPPRAPSAGTRSTQSARSTCTELRPSTAMLLRSMAQRASSISMATTRAKPFANERALPPTQAVPSTTTVARHTPGSAPISSVSRSAITSSVTEYRASRSNCSWARSVSGVLAKR